MILELTALQTFGFYFDKIPIPLPIYLQQVGFNNETATVYQFGGLYTVQQTIQPCNHIYKRNLDNANNQWIKINTTTPTTTIKSWTDSSVTIDDMVYFVGIFTHKKAGAWATELYRFNLTSEEFVNETHIQPVTNQTHIFMIG
eukprot:327149_1